MMHFAPPRVRILGAEVDVVTPRDMLRLTEALVDAGGPAVIANHNAHSLVLARRSAAMRAFYADADLVQIDSTPMILWARMLGLPVSRAHRSTYLDWRDDFWRLAAERGWKIYYLGGAPGVAETAAQRIAGEWPGVSLRTRDGYFDAAAGSADNAALLADIRAFAPDVLFVGMGMPRQEEWIAAHRDELDRGVIFSVGAAFDYEAGAQTAAPRWTGTLGLEWLFRLVSQPRRLAHRYLVEPWALAPAAIGDVAAALSGRR
jgi:N-acetylglucosaminyldiphosphoundecaprenol N-acetyl-beta-D-mannosaminyltransferase